MGEVHCKAENSKRKIEKVETNLNIAHCNIQIRNIKYHCIFELDPHSGSANIVCKIFATKYISLYDQKLFHWNNKFPHVKTSFHWIAIKTTTHLKFEYTKRWNAPAFMQYKHFKVFNVNLWFWFDIWQCYKIFRQLKSVMLNLIASNMQQCNEFV